MFPNEERNKVGIRNAKCQKKKSCYRNKKQNKSEVSNKCSKGELCICVNKKDCLRSVRKTAIHECCVNHIPTNTQYSLFRQTAQDLQTTCICSVSQQKCTHVKQCHCYKLSGQIKIDLLKKILFIVLRWVQIVLQYFLIR